MAIPTYVVEESFLRLPKTSRWCSSVSQVAEEDEVQGIVALKVSLEYAVTLTLVSSTLMLHFEGEEEDIAAMVSSTTATQTATLASLAETLVLISTSKDRV